MDAGLYDEAEAWAAEARGVELTQLSDYARAPMALQGLQLGFAAVDTTELARGVRELAAALEGESAVARRRRPAR
jgi:DNA-binding transcriptional MocR family regulator